jgi:predicted transcriptional regulator
MRRSKKTICKNILNKIVRKENYVSKICKGNCDVSQGLKLLRELEKQGCVQIFKEKNRDIVKLRKKGFIFLDIEPIKPIKNNTKTLKKNRPLKKSINDLIKEYEEDIDIEIIEE